MLYLDRCDIYEYQNVVNPDDHTTSSQEVLVHEGVPCKMSIKTTDSTRDGVADSQLQIMKLILSPDIEVKAGSRIVVTRNGKSVAYKNSGTPSRFFNHQEIGLQSEEDWA